MSDGTDFHTDEGWWFRRNPSGTVTIFADDSHGEPRETVLDAQTWAAAVAAVSITGATTEANRAALALHGVVGEEVQIFVNSRTVTATAGSLSYEEICRLAHVRAGRVPTVTYDRAGGAKREGILAPGEACVVQDGTVLDVAVTGSA